MHDTETQERFIHLRSQGWSFSRIAQEIDVARNTLIAWSRKFQFEIQNRRAIELETLHESLLASRETRLRALAAQLKAVEAELAQRGLAEVSTGRLYGLADQLRRQISREIGPMQFTSPLREIPDGEYHEHVQDWQP